MGIITPWGGENPLGSRGFFGFPLQLPKLAMRHFCKEHTDTRTTPTAIPTLLSNCSICCSWSSGVTMWFRHLVAWRSTTCTMCQKLASVHQCDWLHHHCTCKHNHHGACMQWFWGMVLAGNLTPVFLSIIGGAGSTRLWCKRSRVRIAVTPKVLGSDGIICKYSPLWVYPVFSMRAYSLFRFVLIKLRHWGEPSACI